MENGRGDIKGRQGKGETRVVGSTRAPGRDHLGSKKLASLPGIGDKEGSHTAGKLTRGS